MQNKIQQLRDEKGISQEKLSVEAGITRTYLSGIETQKRNPTVSIGFKIAKALGKKMEEVFFEH